MKNKNVVNPSDTTFFYFYFGPKIFQYLKKLANSACYLRWPITTRAALVEHETSATSGLNTRSAHVARVKGGTVIGVANERAVCHAFAEVDVFAWATSRFLCFFAPVLVLFTWCTWRRFGARRWPIRSWISKKKEEAIK